MLAARLAHLQLVECRQVGLRRGGQGVRVGGPAGRAAAALRILQPHRNLGLGIGALGHRMHLVERQLGLVRDDLVDRVERRVIRVRPDGSDEEMEVEVEVLVDDEAKSDSAKKHRVIQKKAKSAATKAKAKAKAKPQRRDSDDRLEQLEKRLESLERKIEKAIKSLDRSSGR